MIETTIHQDPLAVLAQTGKTLLDRPEVRAPVLTGASSMFGERKSESFRVRRVTITIQAMAIGIRLMVGGTRPRVVGLIAMTIRQALQAVAEPIGKTRPA